jgi:anti-anti-sigma factor
VARAGELEVTLEPISDEADVLRVAGELDLGTTPDFERVAEGADSSRRLVVDLSSCTFLDSAAVRSLLTLARVRGSAGGATVIVAGEPGILRVLEIAAVDRLLPVLPTLDAAL